MEQFRSSQETDEELDTGVMTTGTMSEMTKLTGDGSALQEGGSAFLTGAEFFAQAAKSPSQQSPRPEQCRPVSYSECYVKPPVVAQAVQVVAVCGVTAREDFQER